MLYKEMIQLKHKCITLFVILEAAIVIAGILLFSFFDLSFNLTLLIVLSISILNLISYVIRYKILKKRIVGSKVIFTDPTHELPYPDKFTSNTEVISDMVKSYWYKKFQIPAHFVEFKEGRKVYLYKKLCKEEVGSTFTVLDIHEFSYALIEDEEKRKRLAHLKQLSKA